MVNKVLCNWGASIQNHRLGFWILLLLLTATILIFPVNLRYEYHAIESLYVFGDKLPLFVILYCLWLAVLLILLFTRGQNSDWQRIILLSIFVMVFWGFWAINTPAGNYCDELWNMGHVKYLQEMGHMASLPSHFGYFQFPTLHLFVFSICEICGVDIFTARILFLMFSSIALAVLSYVLFGILLKDSRMTALATLLMGGGFLASQEFWPGNPSLLLLILILVLLFQRQTTSKTFILIVMLASFTISYLPAAACLIFILVAIYLLQAVAKINNFSWVTIALYVVFFLTWEIYHATHFFYGLTQFIPDFLESFVNPLGRLFSGYSGLVAPNTAQGVPLWATLTRFYWVALVIGLGTVVGLWKLIKARRLNHRDALEVGGLLGAIVFFVVCFLAIFRVDNGLRSLRYLPLFTIPLMLNFLSRSDQNRPAPETMKKHRSNKFSGGITRLGGWLQKYVVAILIILFYVSSLPIFLVDKAYICSNAIYPYESSAGEFLESTFYDERLNLYSEEFTALSYTYYCLEANIQGIVTGRNEADLVSDMNRFISDFQNLSNRTSVFVLSERFRQPFHQSAIFDIDDPAWREITDKLAKNDRIYDNGYTIIYRQ